MYVFQPQRCIQCGGDEAKFEYDGRTGGYKTGCGLCGHYERHSLEHDEEGFYCGFSHVVRKGAGVLWFARPSERGTIRCHYLHTPSEVVQGERWLREQLRTGAVRAETTFLTRWNEEAQRVECVVGELLDFLAGKVVRMSGPPMECISLNCSKMETTRQSSALHRRLSRRCR